MTGMPRKRVFMSKKAIAFVAKNVNANSSQVKPEDILRGNESSTEAIKHLASFFCLELWYRVHISVPKHFKCFAYFFSSYF